MKRFSVVIGFVFASSLLLAGCRKQDAVFNTEKTGALEQQTEMAEKSSWSAGPTPVWLERKNLF